MAEARKKKRKPHYSLEKVSLIVLFLLPAMLLHYVFVVVVQEMTECDILVCYQCVLAALYPYFGSICIYL